jgi:hypothetical protein
MPIDFFKQKGKFFFTLLVGMGLGCWLITSGHTSEPIHDRIEVPVPGPTVTVTQSVTSFPISCKAVMQLIERVYPDVNTIIDSAQRSHDIVAAAYVAIVAHDTQALNAADTKGHQLSNDTADARNHVLDMHKEITDGIAKCNADLK